jgi:thiamine biosynthesis lipoprotein ApbE
VRFVVSAEWTRNSLLKTIIWCFLAYTLILWLTNAGLYFSRMSLLPSSVVDYYRGNEERFLQPRSLLGMLEILHFHSFAMGILLLTLTHLLLFVPLSLRVKAWGICVAFVSGVAGELSGWGVRFVHPAFAHLKIGFFLLLEAVILWLMILVARALLFEIPSAYEDSDLSPQKPNAGKWTLLAALVVSTILARAPARAAMASGGELVMGTLLQVTVFAPNQAQAEQLVSAAIVEARHWDDVLTTWRADGELARLNRRAGEGAVRVSPDLHESLRLMLRFSAATDGSFDPAVGPLVRRWRRQSPFASTASGADSRHRISDALTLRAGSAHLIRGAALDAGGIGKGIALDKIALRLRRGSAEAAFLDFGGSSQLALGAPPGSPRGWKVLVSGLEVGSVRGLMFLRDAALSTSRALGPGAEAGPIIDPRSAEPVPPPRLATVLGPDATSTEAWSTALVVLGRPGIPRLEAAGLEALFEDATGASRTRRFESRLTGGA